MTDQPWLRAYGKTPTGMQPIDWQPGYWINWRSHTMHDADGNLVAEDIHFKREEVERWLAAYGSNPKDGTKNENKTGSPTTEEGTEP